MESSFSFETQSLDEWRDSLRDINFWRNGYLNSDAYRSLEGKCYFRYVAWNVGVGPTCCFTRAISSISREFKIRKSGPYDHVIEVDMKQVAAAGMRLNINEKLTIEVAEQLGLLDQEYSRLKEDNDEKRYYTYGLEDRTDSLRTLLRRSMVVPQINQKLSTKRYLLVVENLDEPIKPIKLHVSTEDLSCIPPPNWNNSFWLVSITSKDVYERSKPDYPCLIEPFNGGDTVILTLYSLHQAAKYIMGVVGQKHEQYWHHVVVQCFHYATMLLIPHCSSLHGHEGQQNSDALADITSDELIRQWAAQGIITVDQKRIGDGDMTSHHDKYNDIYQVGNVILDAFREFSLLQLPFSGPATIKADQATRSAAHFLACHGLVAERHTTDELCDEGNNHPGLLEHMHWISHVGDEGWHFSREWLRHGAISGPIALIARHSPQQSRLFMKLQSVLAKLPCLRVLDLSYTPLESLPPSVSCLQKLQLLCLSYTPLKSLSSSIFHLTNLEFLSLRGCYNITSPFNFSDAKIDYDGNTNNQNFGLIHLDLSYSNIKTFHCNFFYSMPNLQELLLLECSNLEELPPSVAALSSLTRLDLTGTQIKHLLVNVFQEMKSLRSLKLIENKNLLFVPGLVCKASGLLHLHIQGCKPMMTEVEVALEGHPTLRSFIFIGAPHMKRMSLRGCRNLENIEIKDADALEELDLSSTAIKELPDYIPNLPRLRRLLLLGVPSLRRFPWHKLQRLPDVFYLDQCSDRANVNNSNPQVAEVCVSDSRLFCSFNDATRDLVCAGNFLKTFYVRVTSCTASTRKTRDEEDKGAANKHEVSLGAYTDVSRRNLIEGALMVPMDDVPPFRETERHVEISEVDRYPQGLEYLIRVNKSISMSNDIYVSCLSDLSNYYLSDLEECNLRQCHQMKQVFEYLETVNLKNACVSHLKSLTYFLRPIDDSSRNFDALKHLCLQHSQGWRASCHVHVLCQVS